MCTLRRTISIIATVLLVLGNCSQAMAAVYDLAEGNISISADATGQIVTQGSNTHQDNDVTVTSNGVTTANTIHVSSTEGATASFTIENLSVSTNSGSAVDIANGSSVELIVSGENDLAAGNYNKACVIHVADADLTITGDGNDSTDDVLHATKGYNAFGAVIGALKQEDFDGNLVIENVTVEAVSYASATDSAVIGSGEFGDFNGTLEICNADVTATGDWATAIGAGWGGKVTGDILIEDSTVVATNDYSGAGIGTGYGDDLSGSITIKNSDVTANAGYMGVGIGASTAGSFTGSISIEDSNIETNTGVYGTGIGAGYYTSYEGTVEIINSDLILNGNDRGTGIGASRTSDFTQEGKVVIQDSDVEIKGMLAIGTGEYWDYYDYGGNFAGDITMTGNTNIYADTSNQEIILGTLGPESEIGENIGTVTIDRNMTLHTADGTALKGEALESVIYGAELVILSDGNGISDDFWYRVAMQIRASDEGQTVTCDAAHRTRMPAYVMDAIRECGVTLVIRWNGGEDITIEKAYDGSEIYYFFLLKELPELLK